MRGVDEKAGAARRRRLQKGRRCVKRRHAGPCPERRHLPHLRLRDRPRGPVRGRADHLRKDRRAQQRVAIGPAAAVSGGVRSGRAVHFVVRCQKRAGHRVAGLGHCGVYYVPLLLYQADGKIVESSEAVQRSAESRSLLEAHQTADETAGGAGRAGCARPSRCDARRSVLWVYRGADFCGAGSDSPPGGDHRHYGAGGLRKIHFGACIFV